MHRIILFASSELPIVVELLILEVHFIRVRKQTAVTFPESIKRQRSKYLCGAQDRSPATGSCLRRGFWISIE